LLTPAFVPWRWNIATMPLSQVNHQHGAHERSYVKAVIEIRRSAGKLTKAAHVIELPVCHTVVDHAQRLQFFRIAF
jgi:hypothetical protein